MKRLLLIALTAAGAVWLGSARLAAAETADFGEWVRTADGWELRAVVEPDEEDAAPPPVHPGLIAALQLGVSLFCLLAFPSPIRSVPTHAAMSAVVERRQGRDRRREGERRRSQAAAVAC